MVALPAHVLGVCAPSPIAPGWLVLSVTIRAVDLHHAKSDKTTSFHIETDAFTKICAIESLEVCMRFHHAHLLALG